MKLFAIYNVYASDLDSLKVYIVKAKSEESAKEKLFKQNPMFNMWKWEVKEITRQIEQIY